MTYQKLIIVGNLGKDPEMRFTNAGKEVTSFSVATTRKFNDKDETLWFRVSTFGESAKVCNQYLKKGSKVLVEGRLTGGPDGSPKIWNKSDGTPSASNEMFGEVVRFLSPKGDGHAEVRPAVVSAEIPKEDEIPF